MMKKRYLVMLTGLVVIGLSISIYQYAETLKTEFVNATQVIPNQGHAWAEMESGPDSIQVTGRKITNLITPVALTDAANKDYVDGKVVSAGGGVGYSTCYILNDPAHGYSCDTGYDSLGKIGDDGYWIFDSSFADNRIDLTRYLLLGSTLTTVTFDFVFGGFYGSGSKIASGGYSAIDFTKNTIIDKHTIQTCWSVLTPTPARTYIYPRITISGLVTKTGVGPIWYRDSVNGAVSAHPEYSCWAALAADSRTAAASMASFALCCK